jgi:energy-coupling factor transporter ATP-binding protein EcfA2
VPLVILIGASGSGKTTIARAIQRRYAEEVEVLYFDQIGVPPVEEMVAAYGSGEAWQRAKTLAWMATLAQLARSGRRLLFEGQTRLSFLAEGASVAGGLAYYPILVDCDDETRSKRLAIERKQPELADENMMNWAQYLRSEARRGGCEIVNTSLLSLDEGVSYVMARLNQSPRSTAGPAPSTFA